MLLVNKKCSALISSLQREEILFFVLELKGPESNSCLVSSFHECFVIVNNFNHIILLKLGADYMIFDFFCVWLENDSFLFIIFKAIFVIAVECETVMSALRKYESVFLS